MAKWDRQTPWRQGMLLTAETVAAFGLNGEGKPAETAVVVISHDCDLAQTSEAEPKVEVIVGRFVDGPLDGTFAHCRNPRRLHIECSGGTAARVIELDAKGKCTIDKDSSNDAAPALADCAPCTAHRMTANERNTLQRWLAARYRRSAFPDEFDRRLNDETRVAERLAKAFKESGKHITAVFFDVDQGNEVARDGPDDVYELTVTLLYSTDEDPGVAEEAAHEVAARVSEIFQSRCVAKKDNANVWQWIELQAIEVVSDEAMSHAQAMRLSRWHADYVSLRADPEQPMLEG